MIKDDLWSDPEEEFGDVEVSNEPETQQVGIFVNNATTLRSSKTTLKKIVLNKVAESEASTTYLSKQLEHSLPLPTQSTTNTHGKSQLDRTSSYRLPPPTELPVVPKVLMPAPIIFEDLWNDNSERSVVTEPPSMMEKLTTPEQASVPGVELDKLVPSEEAAETWSELELEDDLWALPNDLQTLDEGEELPGEWRDNEQVFSQEEEKETSFADLPLLGFESTPDLFAQLENESRSRNFENNVEPVFLLDSFEFIDIEAELAELERAEEELAGQPEVEQAVRIVSRPGRGQALGWMGSSSVLYIDWHDVEKAEQEALERLGYSNLKISEATRAFVIQAARACKLTLRQERLLTAQLANSRSQLAQLPDHDDYEQQRNEIKAEISELERTLVYNLQWVAVKKAPHFLGQGIELDDLIQYGILGIYAGIQHFDISKGARLLVAVNWWVFQALSRAVIEHRSLIRLPVYVHESLANIKRQRIKLEMCLGHPPTHEELADAIQMPVERLEELLGADKKVISLNLCISAEQASDGYSFQTVEEASLVSEDAIDDEMNKLEIKQGVETILQCLTVRERRVIELRYGLDDDGGDDHTLEEVGKEMRVTRERVRQIEERGLRKIRSEQRFIEENELTDRALPQKIEENTSRKTASWYSSKSRKTSESSKLPKVDDAKSRGSIIKIEGYALEMITYPHGFILREISESNNPPSNVEEKKPKIAEGE